MRKFEIYRRVLPSLGPIIFRNVFLLVNAVIFFVVLLLFIFGSFQAGLFLGIVFFLNTLISTIQDIHARVLLEKLQILTALKVVRMNQDKTETLVFAEEIKKGDLLKLKLGDQAPCEGKLISVENLEISEALITGESDSFSKKTGDKIIAGAIITSGSGIMEVQNIFKESRLFALAEDMKKYAASPSSIQRATSVVIEYSGYILLVVLLFVVIDGIILHIPKLQIVLNVGALASTLVPQGLVVAITLLFAIGAASYSRRNVLFQEINATEKLGRIKNLCIDKTGTLTDNILVVENMYISEGFSEIDAHAFTYAYILGSGDSSQTILAIRKYLEKDGKKDGEELEITNALPFSSWRQYGVVEVKKNISQRIFTGTPTIFLPRISDMKEKKWLEDIVLENTRKGKRVLCVASASGTGLPKDFSEINLSMVAVFVFHNTLRQGIENAIKFFNDRGVKIRVLSGDNPETVKAVAGSVGIIGADNVVTGEQIKKWSDADFKTKANNYTVFAQILPEHKVKLVEEFKKEGFTAMVGDGVNDALAMKKADLGIAMFDGVPVTRQLADVILMTNSFTDLPGAVELADHFIRSIEISSGIYINMSVVGLFFFIIISLFGFSYPLTPLNITFINYFTVGFSTILISYWALRPSGKILPANDKPFLKRVMPVIITCAIVEAIGMALVFALSPHYLKIAPSNTLVGLSYILFGFLFLFFAVKVYCGSITKKEKFQLLMFGIFELVVFLVFLRIPFLISFFNITLPYPSLALIGKTLLIIILFGYAQYFVVKKFFLKKT
jgi:cation-transporting ATPase E